MIGVLNEPVLNVVKLWAVSSLILAFCFIMGALFSILDSDPRPWLKRAAWATGSAILFGSAWAWNA